MSGRDAILFAAPGTTCPEARIAYDTIARAAALRFPGVEQRWTFTSEGVRRKLADPGQPAMKPADQLEAMRTDGFTRVAVLSLHLIDGMEFNELAEAVAAVDQPPGNPMHATLTRPLLTDEADWKRALAIIKAGLPALCDQHERVILIAHGSRDPRAQKTMEAAGRICRSFDSRFILGMMIGKPGLGDVVRECEQAGIKKVWLLPCMVTAGYSAREEMAGPADGSWVTTLRRSRIETVPLIQGLGENEAIVSIWMDMLRLARPLLPVSLLVAGRPCLVVGGGAVAARKVGHLLEAEADVTVVSPASCPEIKALAQAGKLQLLERAFEDQDVDGEFLVFAATDQTDVNMRVLDACRKQGVLSSTVDGNWPEGNFVTPAIVRQKGLVVTVSTGGGSCTRAKMVKDKISEFLKTVLPES